MQERARRTRERALNAAAEEFVSQGYSRTTINAVTERMGMSKGALYGHFSSKQTLAEALVAESKDVWEKIITESKESGNTPSAILKRIILDFTARLQSDIHLRAALRLSVDAPTDAPAHSASLLTRVRQELTAVVRLAQKEGAVPDGPPEVVTDLLLMTVYGAFCTVFTAESTDWHTARDRGAVWHLLFSMLTSEARVAGTSLGREEKGVSTA